MPIDAHSKLQLVLDNIFIRPPIPFSDQLDAYLTDEAIDDLCWGIANDCGGNPDDPEDRALVLARLAKFLNPRGA